MYLAKICYLDLQYEVLEWICSWVRWNSTWELWRPKSNVLRLWECSLMAFRRADNHSAFSSAVLEIKTCTLESHVNMTIIFHCLKQTGLHSVTLWKLNILNSMWNIGAIICKALIFTSITVPSSQAEHFAATWIIRVYGRRWKNMINIWIYLTQVCLWALTLLQVWKTVVHW